MDNLTTLLETHHNPDLVIATESPNGNTQTLIFNDGEIVSTKGGWAFMQRSLFPLKNAIPGFRLSIPFPRIYGQHSYAIVKDFETANTIREAMIELNNSSI